MADLIAVALAAVALASPVHTLRAHTHDVGAVVTYRKVRYGVGDVTLTIRRRGATLVSGATRAIASRISTGTASRS